MPRTVQNYLLTSLTYILPPLHNTIYLAGLSAVAATSMPTTALFFVSYECTKTLVQPHVPAQWSPLVHAAAASVGEVVSAGASHGT